MMFIERQKLAVILLSLQHTSPTQAWTTRLANKICTQ